MNQKLNNFWWKQQQKDKQISYLLADVEKNLEEYKQALDFKEKQLSEAKKILVSAKQRFDSINAENIELKAYINKLKEYIIQQPHEQEHFKRIKK